MDQYTTHNPTYTTETMSKYYDNDELHEGIFWFFNRIIIPW